MVLLKQKSVMPKTKSIILIIIGLIVIVSVCATLHVEDDNVNIQGNVTSSNVFIPTYIFSHTSNNISIDSAGSWYNMTFDDEPDGEIFNILHSYSDVTNDTFTIVEDGVYYISATISFVDIAPNPTGQFLVRITKNNEEIHGSLLQKDTTKQNAHGTIDINIIDEFVSNDEIKFQFTSDQTTITTETIALYGDHPDSCVISIMRIA